MPGHSSINGSQMNENGLYEEVIIAGFGGQGIILSGKLLAQTAMKAGIEVTYMPSYGAEVRGGTANCMVIMADEPIASPLVSAPGSLIAMNKASLNKFAPRLKHPGILILNSSLIDENPHLPADVKILAVPADEIAVSLGNKKAANMVALGAYLKCKAIFSPEDLAESLADVLAQRYHKTIPVNTQALQKGAEFASSRTTT